MMKRVSIAGLVAWAMMIIMAGVGGPGVNGLWAGQTGGRLKCT